MFQGYNTPSRLEGDVVNLEIDGVVPPKTNGTFHRIQPDYRYPPIYEDDVSFIGDGVVTAIRIQNGHVNLKRRHVANESIRLGVGGEESVVWSVYASLKYWCAFQRDLIGNLDRNFYTDDELVKGVSRTASNTNVVF